MQILSAQKNKFGHQVVLCKMPKKADRLAAVNRQFNSGYLLSNPDAHKCSRAWDCTGCPASNILQIKHCGGTIMQIVVRELFDRKE